MVISIIISTFNSEKTIQSNIDSIKSQSFKDYEIVVIDKKSSDQTINIIKENNLSNVKFFIEDDLGIFDAINKGINYSSGEIISILHSDDFYNDNDVLKNVIEKFASVLMKSGYASPIRTPRGRDVMAACGQLKSISKKSMKETRSPAFVPVLIQILTSPISR